MPLGKGSSGGSGDGVLKVSGETRADVADEIDVQRVQRVGCRSFFMLAQPLWAEESATPQVKQEESFFASPPFLIFYI